MVDACRVGLCSFYDSGAGVFSLIVGVAVAAGIIFLVKRRKGKRDE